MLYLVFLILGALVLTIALSLIMMEKGGWWSIISFTIGYLVVSFAVIFTAIFDKKESTIASENVYSYDSVEISYVTKKDNKIYTVIIDGKKYELEGLEFGLENNYTEFVLYTCTPAMPEIWVKRENTYKGKVK